MSGRIVPQSEGGSAGDPPHRYRRVTKIFAITARAEPLFGLEGNWVTDAGTGVPDDSASTTKEFTFA